MSVDERLRAGLERNARAVEPEGEARLAAVRARHSRRLVATAAVGVGVAAASVALAAGLGGGADRAVSPEPAPPAPTSRTTPEPDGLIPDSTWRRVLTSAQAEAAGVPRQRIREELGADRRLPLELRLTADTFTQTGDYGGPVWEVGDRGTIAYDDRDRLVITTSQCPGCPGLAIDWRIEGALLVLVPDGPGSGPMDRAVWSGTWRRTE